MSVSVTCGRRRDSPSIGSSSGSRARRTCWPSWARPRRNSGRSGRNGADRTRDGFGPRPVPSPSGGLPPVRLILIDSYSPGRVVEFPVDGGAVLTGRNGRGKTTLLQLVPIFYGENPARIVGTETNRLDFNGYYLPRLTSYIVLRVPAPGRAVPWWSSTPARRRGAALPLRALGLSGGPVPAAGRCQHPPGPGPASPLQAQGGDPQRGPVLGQRLPRGHPGQGRQRQGGPAPARPGRGLCLCGSRPPPDPHGEDRQRHVPAPHRLPGPPAHGGVLHR